MAKLEGVNIVVADMPGMLAFYRRVGIALRDTGNEWDEHHHSGDGVDLDSAAFASAVWDPAWPSGGTGTVLTFRCDSREEVNALHDELVTAGAASLHAPHDAFWGSRYAIVEDPDGNHVGLTSEPDPARQARPPDPPFA